MTETERTKYVLALLQGVATSLRELADRVDRQVKRAELPEPSPLGLPLGSLVEEITSNILWAIPNLHLERIMFRAMEAVDE